MKYYNDGQTRHHQRRRARPKQAGADDAWTLPDAPTIASSIEGAHTLLRDSRGYLCGCGMRFELIEDWRIHLGKAQRPAC